MSGHTPWNEIKHKTRSVDDRQEFDVEEFYDEALDEYRPETLAVPCPGCGFTNHPLPGATVKWTGWRWMGVSHQEPCTDYLAACAACNRSIEFTVRSPQ